MSRNAIALAMTGASGAPYALRLLELLLQSGRPVYLMVSAPAQVVLATETDLQVPGRTHEMGRFFTDRFHRSFVQMVERHGAAKLLEICERLTTEASADVTVSTAHRSKGREWRSVHVSSDFRKPRDGGLPSRADLMLAYVTTTRAKLHLQRGGLAWIDDLEHDPGDDDDLDALDGSEPGQ